MKNYNQNNKTCYIVAGPNGSGKTTFALNYLSKFTDCNSFVNADMIASGLSPFKPATVQIQASRLFLNEIKNYISKKETFAFETTLSGKTYVKLINQLILDNWYIILIYLWIPSIEFSAFRVKERVLQGGHNIPLEAINRRYSKSLYNLFNLYMPICDETICFDNSKNNLKIIFENRNNKINIINKSIYNKMLENIND